MFQPLFKGFLKLGQKYKNIFVVFLVQIKTLKFAFKINWPLVLVALLQKSKIIYVTSAASVIQWGQIIFGSNSNYHIQGTSEQFFCSWSKVNILIWWKAIININETNNSDTFKNFCVKTFCEDFDTLSLGLKPARLAMVFILIQPKCQGSAQV